MSGFVYIWFDRKHSRFYVGSHWGSPDDGYICSSSWMKQAYKHRPEDFRRRIIATVNTNRLDLLIEEERWLQMMRPEELKGVRYYNFKTKTAHWTTDNSRRLTIGEKISKATKEAMARPEVRERILKGYEKREPPSEQTLRKRSESMKKTMAEKFPVDQRKQRMKFGSPEYREFMADHTRNLWENEEHRKNTGTKISEGLKGKQNRLGHTNTEEHRRKISESNKGKGKGQKFWNDGAKVVRATECPGEGWVQGNMTDYNKHNSNKRKPITIDGTEYPSRIAAMQALGLGYKKFYQLYSDLIVR